MRNIKGFEVMKGSLQRNLIGGHVTLTTTKESSLMDLRALTSDINHIRVGEGW